MKYKLLTGRWVRNDENRTRILAGQVFEPTKTEHDILSRQGRIAPAGDVSQQQIFDPVLLSPGRWDVGGGHIFKGKKQFAEAIVKGTMTFEQAEKAQAESKGK
jgi:hypothetical protein